MKQSFLSKNSFSSTVCILLIAILSITGCSSREQKEAVSVPNEAVQQEVIPQEEKVNPEITEEAKVEIPKPTEEQPTAVKEKEAESEPLTTSLVTEPTTEIPLAQTPVSITQSQQSNSKLKKQNKNNDIEVNFSTKSPRLGETVIIHIKNASKATAQTTLPFQPKFFVDENGLFAFLPIAYTNTLGDYSLKIKADDKEFNYIIKVQNKDFPTQYLTIDESVSGSTNTNDGNNEWAKKIEPLKTISDPKKYWDGVFMQPVEGQITTEFGSKRFTNGSKIPTWHSGLDIAAKTGTHVAAANNGRIQFAGKLILTGNTVVIEHGYGLKSFYYHMDSVAVSEGDMVTKGDKIGEVGSTGYSTGPHLHYSLLVNNVFINPWTAFAEGFE
ncbi:MAG: peptidoglycan DD-metalloendopeptidase family protein [Oscillospiraceae bacterium]